jgi:hypothetical protein
MVAVKGPMSPWISRRLVGSKTVTWKPSSLLLGMERSWR